ncbi:MAG: hypothetical protein AB1453_10375 [Chloroflexota bacterium]
MRRLENLVELDALARRYGKRPSEMLGVEGWEGYQLDMAVLYGALAAREERESGTAAGRNTRAKDFRAPVVKRVMKVSNEGVW